MEFGTNIRRLQKLEEKREWQKSVLLAKKLLKERPDDHWLLTRIGSSYYEAHQYNRALKYSKKALELAPDCPLALWDYACALDMLNQESKAIDIWKKLLGRGVKKVAYGECGEGIRWTKSLLNDCRYRIGVSYKRKGKKGLANKYLRLHLRNREKGLPSLYTRIEVERKLKD